jgi:hypothetical protein
LPGKYCIEGEQTMPMKNPPHPGGFVQRHCLNPLVVVRLA